ncbi:MAG: MATE family efflux transporter [Bacteroidales bacterium]|nr:MATE family efflux transporter [Bacteroidales bacterium]
MMKALDKEILRLAVPSILANITVPLVGLVDTAVAGHLHSVAGSSAEFIGGISVGAMILSVIYWNFAFLRASTGGLTAQAYGRMAPSECHSILRRAVSLSFAISVLLLALQWPISRLALIFRDATPGVAALAIRYVMIRIWAAPATLSLMSFKGWFIGMQDTVSSMFTDLIVNVVNIAASIILTLGIGSWQGMGFPGIALGTVIAQYSGLIFAFCVCRFKYRMSPKKSTMPCAGVVSGEGNAVPNVPATSDGPLPARPASGIADFFHLNTDLFVRSLCFTGIYLGYTIIASRYGETLLACANIMMNLLMIFSYFTDGFAYAGEALTGRFIGAKDGAMLRRSVAGTFRWSMGVAGIWMFIYALAGLPMLRLMSDDPAVTDSCMQFIPWLIAMPPIGCAAFTWDGIYIGATASKAMRNAMTWALAAFLGVWFAGRALAPELFAATPYNPAAIHLLMAAYFAHLAARTVHLSIRYRAEVLSRL